MASAKQEIVTFKADAALLRAMQGVPNRSEFIRAAVLAALDGTCPLCRGTGTLTLNQKRHWDAFAIHHRIKRCHKCEEIHLTCAERPPESVHRAPHRAPRRRIRRTPTRSRT